LFRNPFLNIKISPNMLVRTSGIFAFLITLSFFLQGCKKDTPPTVVKATVVDYYTREPLEGVAVTIYKWRIDTLPPFIVTQMAILSLGMKKTLILELET
jgi:hypothetical protein